MALTPRRTLLGLVLACLAITVVLLPPRGSGRMIDYLPWTWYVSGRLWSPPPVPDPLIAENNRLARAARAASQEWLVLSWRDSILARPGLVAAARGSDPVLLVKGSVLPRRLEAFRSIITRSWQHLPRRDPQAWTVVAIIPDSTPGEVGGQLGRLGEDEQYLLFAPLIEEPGCVLLISASAVNQRNLSDLVDALSPCGWRAAFGPPAPAIGSWLRRTNWAAGDLALWAPAAAGDPWGSRRLAAYIDESDMASLRIRAYVGQLSVAAGNEGRIAIAGCLTGEADACGRAVTEPRPWRARTGLAGARGRRWIGVDEAIVTTGLLSAMLERFGPDRFHQFWGSRKPVDEAFRELAGVSLGTWARDLVRARVGDTGHEELPRAMPAIASLLVGLALVGVAAVAARRREAR